MVLKRQTNLGIVHCNACSKHGSSVHSNVGADTGVGVGGLGGGGGVAAASTNSHFAAHPKKSRMMPI